MIFENKLLKNVSLFHWIEHRKNRNYLTLFNLTCFSFYSDNHLTLRGILKQVETKNSKKLGSAAGAVLQYTTELITGFFPLVNISAVIAAGIFNRVETDSGLT